MFGGIVIHVIEKLSPTTKVLRPFSNDRSTISTVNLTHVCSQYIIMSIPKYSAVNVMEVIKDETGDVNVTSK